MYLIKLLSLLVTGAFFAVSCSSDTRFQKMTPNQTGIDFENTVQDDTSFNFLNYLYFYNGGGVAAGDINNDGLADLYFTSNLQENKLYLNEGDFRFQDVTEESGTAGEPGGWATGAAMADINGDGYLDIYVSNVNYLSRKGNNELFLNNGDGTFTEKAEEFGLNFEGYSVQAAFFDYDKDGDLDMYLLNHSVHSVESYRPVQSREKTDPKSGDRLFRYDGDKFNDVTEEAGIFASALGFGLGVTISDINMDGWPDIYVANDFHEDDYLYINRKDGSFEESIRDAARHTSQFSMSVDIADINNDGALDIATTDMLPGDEKMLKISGSGDTYEVADIKRQYGYQEQYSRNVLQLNRNVTQKDGVPAFSEIGYMAGIEATDWSWSGLLADLDNDGLRDFFVANGIYRRPNDLDYIKYISNQEVQKSLQGGINPENLELVKRMPQIKIPNAVFQNNGDLTFSEKSTEWGLGENSYSNGTIYADLNNDGSLDLAINNVNQTALVYKNRSSEQEKPGNFIQFHLSGNGKNTSGIGAKLFAYAGEKSWVLEQSPVRGFQSSVSHRLHLGLGNISTLDSLVVIWPDDSYQLVQNIEANQLLKLEQEDASGKFDYSKNREPEEFYFEDITETSGLDFEHSENQFVDFNWEVLIPHKLSTLGPPVAVADVNDDGLDDLFVGGGRWQSGEVWIQKSNGTFHKTSQEHLHNDRLSEDTDADLFDANGDGHVDLIVASGGGQAAGQMDELLDRLYINDGSGKFIKSDEFPKLFTNTGVVTPGDFDGDGDIDLFLGGRSVPGMYGMNPRSFLLENDGAGKFTDITESQAVRLQTLGMVTDAKWADYDGDEKLDLIISGEWMPVTIFKNKIGQTSSVQPANTSETSNSIFEEVTEAAGLSMYSGWWNVIEVVDVNNDGHLDLLAGNLGLNSNLKASREEPMLLYLNDFDGDGRVDPIITHYKNGYSYPLASLDRLIEHMPSLRKKYPSYGEYGAQRIDQIFSREKIERSSVKSVTTLASVLFLNNGDGTYQMQELPQEAQFAPVYSFNLMDVNGDKQQDVYITGNFTGVRPNRGNYDASFGSLLIGNSDGNFVPEELSKIGYLMEGEGRDMKSITLAGGEQAFLISYNNGKLRLLIRKSISD